MGVRRMRPGALYAVPGGVWVVDDELPVLAFVNGCDLSTTFVGDWFEESVVREWVPRRSVCTALAGDDSECWIASPDAHGVVRLSVAEKSVLKMPAPVRALASAGGACWALLDLPSTSVPRGLPPLWRLDRAGARSFDTGFMLLDLIVAGDTIFALGRRAGDPRDGEPFHCVVLRVSADAQAEVLVEIEQPHGWQLKLHAGQRPWLEVDSQGLEWPGAHWVEPLEQSPEGWRRGEPVAMPRLARLALDDEDVAWAWVRAGNDVRDFDHPFAVLRRPLPGVAESWRLLPGDTRPGTASGGRAWCLSVHRLPLPQGMAQRSVLRLNPRSEGEIEVAYVAEWPDIAPLIPYPCTPDGVDPDAWAESQRANIEAELTQAGRSKAPGETYPYIRGATIESVSLAGEFPATECVIRFGLEERPGIAFGQRIRCFDDMGAPKQSDYDGLRLKERIATGAIPPPGRDIPDADGVVWI
jgi:hypothetical protein